MNNIKQLSVFLENRPGHLGQLCRVLAGAGINIVTQMIADTTEFGITRLIIREWREARELIENAGFAVRATDVLAIEVAHEPGGLVRVLDVAAAAGFNIEYMYAFALACDDANKALVVIRPDGDAAQAAAALAAAGIGVLSAETFYSQEKP